MDTGSFITYIKTEDIYSDIVKYITSNYELDRPLPEGKSKKVVGLMKAELGKKVVTQFAALRPKAYSYLTDDHSEN